MFPRILVGRQTHRPLLTNSPVSETGEIYARNVEQRDFPETECQDPIAAPEEAARTSRCEARGPSSSAGVTAAFAA